MAADGLIQSRALHQERRPIKRLFSLFQFAIGLRSVGSGATVFDVAESSGEGV